MKTKRSQQRSPRSPLIKAVGRKIAEYRRNLDLTQEEWAEKLDVSTWYVRRIELGRENLTLETMEKLAKLLGVEVVDFFKSPKAEAGKGRPGQPRTKSEVAKALRAI